MRYTILMLLFCGAVTAGCSQYTVLVRTYDENGKPVMDASIAVKGKYVASQTERAGKKVEILKDFFIMDEFTYGEFLFYVSGLPAQIDLSVSSPGFYKYVGTAVRDIQPDGYIEYAVTQANPPYDLNDLRVKKKGTTISVDAFLLQMKGRKY